MAESTTYPYAVFFCQQAIEKALKGLYVKKCNQQPEKIHSLVALVVKLDIPFPDNIRATIQLLNTASVSVRYPPDLEELLTLYSKTEFMTF
jgi:HEPN domain-containing protein